MGKANACYIHRSALHQCSAHTLPLLLTLRHQRSWNPREQLGWLFCSRWFQLGRNDCHLCKCVTHNDIPLKCMVQAARTSLTPSGKLSLPERESMRGSVSIYHPSFICPSAIQLGVCAAPQEDLSHDAILCSRNSRNNIKNTKHGDVYFNSANTGKSPEDSTFHYKAIR